MRFASPLPNEAGARLNGECCVRMFGNSVSDCPFETTKALPGYLAQATVGLFLKPIGKHEDKQALLRPEAGRATEMLHPEALEVGHPGPREIP